MEKPPPNKIVFISLLFCLVFFSCSENNVEVLSAHTNIVFDFEENEKPLQRLSVFIALSSNVRRLETIKISHGEYTWIIEEPLLIQAENKTMAGYMHLDASTSQKVFPKGDYVFECIDAAGNKAEGKFILDYNDDLLELEFSTEFFEGPNWEHRVAVYSYNSELLYFDSPKDGWIDANAVFSRVKNSASLRHIYDSGATLCLGPKIFKEGVSENGI